MNGNHTHRFEQGTAIIGVLIIVQIIFLFMMMTIMLKMHGIYFIKKEMTNFQAYLNTHSAAQLTLVEAALWNVESAGVNTSLFHTDSTKVDILPWGFYFILQVESRIGNSRQQTDFLLYGSNPDLETYSLILTREDYPLIPGSKTRISGLIRAKPGLKLLNPNRNSDFILDTESSDQERLTKDSQLLQQFRYFGEQVDQLHSGTNGEFRSAYRKFTLLANPLWAEKGKNQQWDKAVVIFFDQPAHLSDIRFNNKTIIRSNSKISIGETVMADQLLVYAPEIELHGCTVSGHFYATRKLNIAEKTHLLYPSVAALVYSARSDSCRLVFGDNSKFHGTVVILCTDDLGHNIHTRLLKVSATTNIDGLIYSDTYIELEGIINGTVITPGFYLSNPPGGFMNYTGSVTISNADAKQRKMWPLRVGQSRKNLDVFEY